MRLTEMVVMAGFVAMSVGVAQQASGADRAQAGPQASAVTVPLRTTPAMPEGNTGLAAKYPGDVGIEKDPDVVFVESFEGSVDEVCRHWEAATGKPIMSKSNDVPPGSGGKQSLLLTRVAGGTDGYMDGGNLYRRLKNEKGDFGYEQLFFRFYMKFNREHAPIHHYGSGLIGFHPPTPWPQGGAGAVKKPETAEFRRDWYCKTVAQLRNSWKCKQPKSEGAQQWLHHGTKRCRNSSPLSALSPQFCSGVERRKPPKSANSANGWPSSSPYWISNNSISNSNNKKLKPFSSGLSKPRDNVIRLGNPSSSRKTRPWARMALERG